MFNGSPALTVPFKTLWIIGASTGIGRDTALAFARAGVKVAASARRPDLLNALVAEGGGNISAFPLDVGDAKDVAQVADAVRAQLVEIDAMLFAAATWNNDKTSQAKASVVSPVFEVNVFGALRVIEAILPRMKLRRQGRIVLISSVAGFRGLPRALAYGASKAALTHIAEALRFECKPLGITVQVVHPGFVKTPLTDKNDFKMPFLMSAESAAARMVAGMSHDGFEISFPRRFTYMLKLLRLLPYRLYFALVGRATTGL
jgi:NAD(P)-dependent dehydrogenase (short-subunit alcohol dehydrogenase family)